jgi:aminoglycoside/choline kinase family phosphotransferase
MNQNIKKFILGFLRTRGDTAEDWAFESLQGDGSKRIFWRVTGPRPGLRYIAMVNPPCDHTAMLENRAYLMIGNHLRRKGVSVPEIYHCDLEQGWFILEDLGKTNLQDLASSSDNPLPLYEKVLENLFRLQMDGAKGFDPSWCSQTEVYNRTVMRTYESDYFRAAFLCGYLGLKEEWPELEPSFDYLAERASRADNRFFLHRDFQSRNIMISSGHIGIIDWQGGRLGPLGYDLASLLIDPYTGLSNRQREHLYEHYLLFVKGVNARWAAPFEKCYPYLAIQRNLQILGAFSFLTKVMRKEYFEAYMPAALRSLCDLLHQVNDHELSSLQGLIDDLQP